MNEGSIPPPQPAAQSNLNLENKAQSQIQQQQQLFKLPVGATLNAAVIGGDKNGNVIIKFAGNDLLLSSPLALARGAQLALKVDGGSGTINLQLLSVDGKLPATQAQANSNNLQQNPPILKLLNIIPSDSKAAQTQLQNIQAPAAQAAAAAPAKAVVVGSAAATNASGVVTNPVAEALAGIRTQIKTQLPTEQATKVLDSLPQTLKAGSEIGFKVTNIQPNTAQPTPPIAGQNPQIGADNKVLAGQEFHFKGKPNFTPTTQISPEGAIRVNAQVLSNNNSGQIVVDTALGKISLNTILPSNQLSVGSLLNLQVESLIAPKEAADAKQTPLQTLANDWPALRELAQALSNAGEKAPLNKLAGLDSIFASRMAGFFSSVKNQNINNWLSGELMDSLDVATKEQLMGKLRADFSNMGRLANDSNSNWQSFLFPVFDGEELRQAKFHLRYLEDENGDPNKELGSRFIVEFDGGTFGEMQLDGMVRKRLANNNFDLVVKSHEPIEDEIQNDIREIFTNAQELTGFKGSLEFNVLKDYPHKILDEKLAKFAHSDDILEV